MPVRETTSTTTDPEQQQRDREQARATTQRQVPQPSYLPSGGSPATLIPTVPSPDVLSQVEKASYNSLPSDLSYSLATSGSNLADVVRVAKQAARLTDLPWAAYAGAWGLNTKRSWEHVPDPYQPDQNLTLKSLGRLTGDYEPAIIASMLPTMLYEGALPSPETPHMKKAGPGATPGYTNPRKVSKFLRAFAPALRQQDVSAQEAIGVSIQMVRDGVPQRNFQQNFRSFLDLANLHMDEEPFSNDWKNVVGLAMTATKDREKITNTHDAAMYMLKKASPELHDRIAAAFGAAQGVSSDPEHDIPTLGEQDTKFLNTFLNWERADGTPLPVTLVGGHVPLTSSADDFNNVLGEMSDQLVLDQTMFDRSPVGKVLNPAFRFFNAAQTKVEQVFTYAATPVTAALTGAASAAGFEGEIATKGGFLGGWDAAFRARDSILADLSQGAHWGTIFGETVGAPTWTYPVLDLAEGIIVDPFIIVGKGATSLRSLMADPALLEHTLSARSLVSNVPIVGRVFKERGLEKLVYWDSYARKFTYNTRYAAYQSNIKAFASGRMRWGKVSGLDIGKAGLRSDGEMLDEMGKVGLRFSGAQSPLDEPYMLSASRLMRERYGSWTPEATTEWEQVMLAHAGFQPAPGSVAAEAYRLRAIKTGEDVNTWLAVSDTFKGKAYASTESGLLIPQATATDLVQDIGERYAGMDFVPLRFEVPRTYLPFGIHRVGNGLARSHILGDSSWGRRVIAGTNLRTGNRFKVFEAPERQLKLRARAWREFKVEEINGYESRMAAASISKAPEEEIRKVLDEMDTEAISRIMAYKKMPLRLEQEFIRELRQTTRDVNDQVFLGLSQKSKGFARTPAGVGRPLMEPQLVNDIFTLDPVQVRDAVNGYTGIMRRFRDAVAHRLDSDFPTLKTAQTLKQLTNEPLKFYEAMDSLGEIMRAWLRIWKFTVVPRPGYIGRVILLDEGSRFTATTGSILERLAATNLEEASRSLIGGMANPLPGVPIAGRVTGTAAKAAGGVVGKAADETLGRLLDRWWPDNTLEMADGVKLDIVDAKRPGLRPPEPAANSSWMEAELTNQMIRSSKANQDILKSVNGSWRVLTKDDPGYFQAWAHALNNQFGLSKPGRLGLESVVAGDTIEITSAKLLTFARENKALMDRIGVAPHEFDVWASDLSKGAHAYSLGSPEIAQMGLNRTEGLDYALRAIKDQPLPPVHGPMLAKLNGLDNNIFRKYVEYWYETFVRGPENWVNRMPFYGVWKARAEKAMVNHLRQSGFTEAAHSAESIEQTRRAVDLISRDFALGQVKKVMFDFTEQHRIGEMMGMVFPFMQPYQESFAAWGHILTQKNPAFIGYANQIFRFGMESGFIQRDPETGELLIPTSWWMNQANFMRWISGADFLGEGRNLNGLTTVTPINAVSMFINSTLNVGGVSFPVPSTSPWAGVIGRWVASKWAPNGAFAGYLNSFGPKTPIAPAWVEKALTGVFPALGNGDFLASQQKAVYRTFEQDGTLQQMKDEGYTAADIEQVVNTTARNMLIARGLMGAYQLGSTQVRYSFTDPQRELIDAIQADPVNGAENWMRNNPGHDSLAVSTMAFAATIIDPATGKPVLDPDSGQPISGIRLPYSDFTVAFLHNPRTKELIDSGYGPFIAGLVLDQDKEVAQKFSLSAFNQLIYEGWFKPVTYDRFATSAEAQPFWEAVDYFYQGPGWNTSAYQPAAGLKHRIGENPKVGGYDKAEAKATERFGEDSERVRALKDGLERQFLVDLKQQYPQVATKYIQYTPDPENNIVDATWMISRNTGGMPNPVVIARLRSFASEPDLQSFPSIQGLNEYLDGRDAIYQKMSKLGISDISSSSAQRLGFDKKWEELKARVVEAYPTSEAFINSFLSEDLGGVPNAADIRLGKLSKAEDGTPQAKKYDTYFNFDSEYRKLSPQISEAEGDRKFSLLAKQRDLVNDLYQRDPKLVDLWYKAKGFSYRQDHIEGLTTRDPFYWSRFDWHLQGYEVSKLSMDRMVQVQDWTTQIYQENAQATLDGKDYSVGSAFAAMNGWLRDNWLNPKSTDAKATKDVNEAYDPNFANSVEHLNTWGFPIVAAGYTKGEGQAQDAWRRIIKLANDFRVAAEANSWTGTGSFDVKAAQIYAQSKQWISEQVQKYRANVSSFDKQWTALDTQLFDSDLIDFIVPDDWYGGIGVVEA